MTHATATTLHEDLLSRSDLGAIHQPFPSRDDDERQCRGLAHRQLGGLQSQQISIHRRIFCERALDSSDSPSHPINLVTRPKFRDASTDLFDVPSQVDAKNCREWMASVRRCASSDFGIGRGISVNLNAAPLFSTTNAFIERSLSGCFIEPTPLLSGRWSQAYW